MTNKKKGKGYQIPLVISSNHQCSQLLQCDGCHTSSPVPGPTKFAGFKTPYNPCELHHLPIILQCFGCLQAEYNRLSPSNAVVSVHMVKSTESSLNDDLMVRDFGLCFVRFQSGHLTSDVANRYLGFLLDKQNQDCILRKSTFSQRRDGLPTRRRHQYIPSSRNPYLWPYP